MIEYAKAINANNEVLEWCETILRAAMKKNNLDQSEIEHTIDFLVSDASPQRLRKMSWQQAKSGADKWSKAQQKKGRNLVDNEDDIETIHDFFDGTRIVKLLSKKAYQREGFFMSHCVGAYDPESSTIYSYRDKNNEPHATFEISKRNEQITQIKGKGNGAIHPKYIHPILIFLKTIGMDVRPSDMINLGYQHVTDATENVLNMFVDQKGRGPEVSVIFNKKYVVAARN